MSLTRVVLCWLLTGVAAKEPVDCINPLIGASTSVEYGEGKTFPGAATPFGLVQLSPDTITGGDNGPGYSYHHKTIEGFSFTHLSGIGWYGDLGNLQVMPTVGPLRTACGRESQPGEGYRSRFSHDTEVAAAGYYAVTLADSGIRAECTATPRAGLLRFTFPQADTARIHLDLARRVAGTSTRQYVKLVGDHAIEGWMLCTPAGGGWGNGAGQVHYKLHFAVEFSRPLTDFGVWSADIPADWKRGNQAIVTAQYRERVAAAKVLRGCREYEGAHVGWFVEFPSRAGEQVLVKAGVSFVSVVGARANLTHDLDHWDFERVRAEARARWADALAGVSAEGGTDAQREAFFTALYHCLLDPRSVSDTDGQYIGADDRPHRAPDFTYRSVFSGWDVFRSQFPLLSLIRPDVVTDEIHSQLQLAELSGRGYFERWELLNAYSGCMIGDPLLSILAGACQQGLRGYDLEQAWRFARATNQRNVNKFGFAPGGLSQTVENAYYDHCLARLAAALGKPDEVAAPAARALWYANIYDPTVGNLRARAANGSWTRWLGKTVHGQGCVESNPYQQGWFVPHDVQGLINLMGRERFLASLNEFFDKTPLSFKWNDYYNHANEPVHHVPYLFTYAGEPWLTQKWARTVMDHAYGPGVKGLCGNEDVGQMSAWYVLSAVGFHPVSPVDGTYVLGSPLFDKVTLRLDPRYYPGKSFTVVARENSPTHPYIQSATLNGRPLRRAWLRHAELVAGGTLELVMGAEPNRAWGAAPADRPPSLSQPVECTGLSVTPTRAKLGEELTATVTLANLGDAPTPARALLWTGEQTLASVPVTLAAGERRAVAVPCKPAVAGRLALRTVGQPAVDVEVVDERPLRLLSVTPSADGRRVELKLSRRPERVYAVADCRVDGLAPQGVETGPAGVDYSVTLAAPLSPGRHRLSLTGLGEVTFGVVPARVEVFRTTGAWAELAPGAPSASDYADAHSGHGATVSWLAPFAVPHASAGAQGNLLPRLLDGVAARGEDDTGRCAWLDGGEARLLLDLQAEVPVNRVNTYSWHRGDRAPQRFVLYGAAGATSPAAADVLGPPWERLAAVDTTRLGEGGKHVSSVSGQPLGVYRYLLWVLQPVAAHEQQGTFLTELDVNP